MAKNKPRLDVAFAELTWDQLEEWAGQKILARGRTYLANVEQAAITQDGGLVAWVNGTRRYATLVWIGNDGELMTSCTCPYDWGPCKHAVALVLVGIKALQNGAKLPVAAEDDDRLILIDEYFAGEEDWSGSALGQAASLKSSARENHRDGKNLKDILSKMKKAELVDLVSDLASQFPEVGRSIWDRNSLSKGDIKQLVRELRREIGELTREPAWRNHWDGRGEVPDYSPVCAKMAHLLSAGYADQLLELGAELWHFGVRQIEESDDDGETAMQIGQCMDVVMWAVKQSSLAPADQILWFVKASLEDEFDVLADVGQHLQDGYGQEDWNIAADSIDSMLTGEKVSASDEYTWRFRRNRVLGWLTEALEKAGRVDEIIPLLEREAPSALCYEEIVDRLIQADQRYDACRWAVKGFKETVGRWEGIARLMVERLLEDALQAENFALAGSYLAFKFFHDPDLELFREIQKCTNKVGLWPGVRQSILAFLESGERPDTATDKTKETPEPSPRWPLPGLPIKWPQEQVKRNEFPRYDVLFNIAIDENRLDDAVQWYQESRTREGWFGVDDEVAAEALMSSHPDIALEIWRELAEQQISRVKTSAYKVAGGYLRKAKALYDEIGHGKQWQEYIAAIRAKHKAKRKLMEVLDKLEGKSAGAKRIIDAKM